MEASGKTSLLAAIRHTPIIDHHAHPLLRETALEKHPLLSIATEAHGDALPSSRTSLAHFRAVRQLSAILGCESTWEAVEAGIHKNRKEDYGAWTKRCLEGIETVLVDDGLDNADDGEGYRHFDQFVHSKCRRIVRIEVVATNIIARALAATSAIGVDWRGVFEAIDSEFADAINHAIADENVVGFKSVICYRTGLALPSNFREVVTEAYAAFERIWKQRQQEQDGGTGRFTRLDHEGLNEHFVHGTAMLISLQNCKKPFQFHTGLGDNDITLTKASPAHMQDFIRAYPKVTFVLLHSGYPFTREVGYLAAMYANVYADIGEIFPILSRGGQASVIRQILELCPVSKILWSTDGHWFPETYLLAVEQMREVLGEVLCELVDKKDLTWMQAEQLVEDVLFNNSNALYGLGLKLVRPQEKSQLSDVKGRTDAARRMDTAQVQQTLAKVREYAKTAQYLRVYWCDMTSLMRMRSVPLRRVLASLEEGEDLSLGVTAASLGLMQDDVPVPEVSATGEYRLHPEFVSLKRGPRPGHLMVMGEFANEDGSAVRLCPRTELRKVVNAASRVGFTFMIGFEIEMVFVRPPLSVRDYHTVGIKGHAWCLSRAMEDRVVSDVLEPALADLAATGVYVEMIHPESAPGQFEVVLPPASPLEAVDTLLHAREVIASRALRSGYSMTLHPKPYKDRCGTASHVHMSVHTAKGPVEQSVYEQFYAGILRHLRAICAFTLSSPVSYDRLKDGCWAGSTWVAWGTQNRETPLRKIKDSHWEIKCVDGLANPYLALSALIAGGMDGVVRQLELAINDCLSDPATLSDDVRREIGIHEKLPANLEEALAALSKDDDLCEALGKVLITRYCAVKRAEICSLTPLDYKAARAWIMDRY